jgi:predicted DNA-binding transcriptional regulator AlpA
VSEMLPKKFAAPILTGEPSVSSARSRSHNKTGRSTQELRVEPLLLDARQAAALYGVSGATWHRMVSAGSVPASFRPSPGCVRWRTEELRAHIAAGMPDRAAWEAMRAMQTKGYG